MRASTSTTGPRWTRDNRGMRGRPERQRGRSGAGWKACPTPPALALGAGYFSSQSTSRFFLQCPHFSPSRRRCLMAWLRGGLAFLALLAAFLLGRYSGPAGPSEDTARADESKQAAAREAKAPGEAP